MILLLLFVDKFPFPKQFPLRDASTKAFGRLLLHLVQSDPSNASIHLDIISCLVSALHDDSSEVRRRALSALKAVSKVCSFGSNEICTVINRGLGIGFSFVANCTVGKSFSHCRPCQSDRSCNW